MQTFEQAQAAFDRAAQPEDFVKVAAQYQALLDQGIVSGGLLYNQGNAFQRAGERGRAVAAYRQAQRYRPRDPYLAANLQTARGELPAPPTPLIERVLFWQNWLSYPRKWEVTAALTGLAVALGVATLWWGKRSVRSLALATAAVAVVLAISASYDWYRFEYQTHAVVIDASVVARKGNSVSYGPAFTKPLVEGTELVVLARRGGWLQVRVPDAPAAWVPEAAIVQF